MLDGWTVEAWLGDVLTDIQNTGIAEFKTVILNREPAPQGGWGGRFRRLFSGKSKGVGILLWLLYHYIDKRMRRDYAEPFRQVDAQKLLTDAKVIEVLPTRKGFVHRFSPADVEAIRAQNLDVILRFGFNIIRGDILGVARYGVWSYHHGDNNEYRGGPPGFWEMYERNDLTGTILQILTEELDGGQVIYRTYGATRSFESLAVNKFFLYKKAIPFISRCLRRLHHFGPEGIAPESKGPPYTRRLYRTPKNVQMARFLVRTVGQMIKARFRTLFRVDTGHWFLGVARGIEPGPDLAGKIKPLHPPKGHFWADPMIAPRDGKDYVFFEDYDYETRLGTVSVFTLDDKGRPGPVQSAMKKDFHLSYPFLFEWNGEHYMVPETASVRAVQLYRATGFPTQWEYVQDLLSDIRAVDATLYQHEGRWYLFTGVAEAGGSSWDELFLFVADKPTGEWSPHPMNPIVSDVRFARPAGALFVRDGVLYRPGQNSERGYGYAVSVMEVTELSPERYSEKLAYQIKPDWLRGIHGCHTLALAGDLMVLDCKTVRWGQ
jgi:hypothetical protein